MKKIILTLSFISVFCLSAFCQSLRYSGLELFNPYIQNPAFIKADSIFEFDIVGNIYMTRYSGAPKSFFLNSICSINQLNSSFRLSADFTKFGPGNSKDFTIGYAYCQPFSENFSVMLGTSLTPSRMKYQISTYSEPYEYKFESTSYDLDLGLGIKFKKLTVGISTNEGLQETSIYTSQSGADSTVTSDFEFKKFYGNIKYDFVIANDFSLSPQVGLDYYDAFTDKPYKKVYWGLIAEYKNILGVGITESSRSISIFGSLKLGNNIQLIGSIVRDGRFILNSDTGLTFIGQFRITI